MSEYLKFVCPECGNDELLLIETNAVVERHIRLSKDSDPSTAHCALSDADVPLASFQEYRCARCRYRLPVEDNYTYSGLRQYLELLPCNKEGRGKER